MAHLSCQVPEQPCVSTSRLELNTRGQDMSGPLIPTFEVHLVAALIWGERAPFSSLQIFGKSTNPASHCQGTRTETYFSTDLNCENEKQTACRI